ncbi:MAG: pentapeptide repeat-containing protein [Phormidesmis sp.]
MSLDFSGQSLVGRSFKGEDLSGANFSYADIRSVSFSGANLAGATFHKSRSGLSISRQVLQVLLLLIGSATIGVTTMVAGTFSAALLIQKNMAEITAIPGILCIASLTSISLALIIKGYTPRGFQFIWASCALSVVGITVGVLTSLSTEAADAAGGATGAMILMVVNSVVLTIAGFIGGKRLIGLCLFCSSAIALLTAPLIYPRLLQNLSDASNIVSYGGEPFNLIGMGIVVLEVLLTGTTVATGILNKAGKANAEKFDLIQKVATPFTAVGGTSFRRASLTHADFSQANLHCTDFTGAHLIGTSFYHSKSFNTVKFNGTIYTNTPARLLALTRNGCGKTYSKLNLQGINLTQADLSQASFIGCNLKDAILQQANLTDADLTNVQAIGTDFQNAQLTGSCIEGWNIDSTTQIDSVDCRFVYLRTQQRERRPSSGTFKVGEFSKLFQEVIDTVDLIFQGGLDWQALQTMMADVNAQPSVDAPLNIRSIENKDDGVVVVRVDAPPAADKSVLHADLTERYTNALAALEAKYQYQLAAKDEQIATYKDIHKEQQEHLSAIAQALTGQFAQSSVNSAASSANSISPSKLVALKLTTTDHNIQATLQIGNEGTLPFLEQTATLPLAAPVLTQYQQWQTSYRQYLNALSGHACPSRLSAPASQLTNISLEHIHQQLQQLTQQTHQQFNQWISADSFRPLREKLLENLSAKETIRIVLQADNVELWRLPWHRWELLDRYPQAEITLSTHHYQRQETESIGTPKNCGQEEIRVLVVLGEDVGAAAPSEQRLDLQTDLHLLQNLPHTHITTLTEPTRQTFNDYLWEHPYDILFFAGHSTTEGDRGYLRLNKTDTLTLADIHYALKRACQQGLQLAIFNSCDGLGLVHALSDRCLNQMIVMKEAIPDPVAQLFLQNLLTAFAGGQSLPQAVRQAREKLQGVEDRFLCASELPILCQPAATAPLSWRSLQQS